MVQRRAINSWRHAASARVFLSPNLLITRRAVVLLRLPISLSLSNAEGPDKTQALKHCARKSTAPERQARDTIKPHRSANTYKKNTNPTSKPSHAPSRSRHRRPAPFCCFVLTARHCRTMASKDGPVSRQPAIYTVQTHQPAKTKARAGPTAHSADLSTQAD